MGNGVFVFAVATSAALLALWIHVRFPSLAPDRLGRTVLHAVLAFALLKVAGHGSDSVTSFVAIFGLLLPALVYALLCTIWMIKFAQTALGFSR